MLSIVTITFNNFDELVATLKSLQSMTGVEWESVVINGGTCERTREYLKNYQGTVVNEKDQGISDAFSKGVTHSKGDFILFLNSGDVLADQNYPAQALQFLKNNPKYAYVHADMVFEDAIAGPIRLKPTRSNLGRGMTAQHPTLIAKKEIFEKIGSFKLQYKVAMDYEWLVRASKNGFKGKYLSEIAPVRMDGAGVSSTSEWRGIKECYRALKENEHFGFNERVGFFIRILFFAGRKSLIALGLSQALSFLKRMKRRV